MAKNVLLLTVSNDDMEIVKTADEAIIKNEQYR
jgi:hypothetical protein